MCIRDRVYADDGLLTADPRLANEVAMIFDFFKQNYRHYNYKNLLVSPFSMRETFVKHIERETELAKEGKKGWMILKMNSLIDPGMIQKLYQAAKAGVKIQLIVRGIFGLMPNPEEFGENIQAISIVDKYLEHSRIFLFGNGGDEKMYISSADWMPRNLNRRIEVACPVYDDEIREEVKEMLRIQLRDNTKARILDPQLQNNYNRKTPEFSYRAQEDYYNYIKQKQHISMKIYHNPRCSKSRAGLKYLEEKGYDVTVVKYLDDGLTEQELEEIIAAKMCIRDRFWIAAVNKQKTEKFTGMFSNKDFINREISWLSFNERVLQEADDPNTPLFERIRFIGIFSNNLDEFFRVRVATVRRMVDLGEDEENLLGDYTPVELYDKIQNIVYEQQNKVQQIFVSIREELKQNNIFIINEEELSHKQGVFVKKYFYEKVLPNLVPIMLSKKNKFPYLRDRSVYLAVKLIKKSDPSDFAYSLIRIPGRTCLLYTSSFTL